MKAHKEVTVVNPKDDPIAPKKLDQDGARRKHHRLWTVSEVRKLIDGVAQYGVGRWSHIKKLYFSSSAHRTPVDLKVSTMVTLRRFSTRRVKKKKVVASSSV